MTKLTEHWTLEELCHSNKADSLNILNVPDLESAKNLEALAINILEPLRVWYGKPIKSNCGFRSPEVNKAVGGQKKSQHCLDDISEILTNNGWKNIHNISKLDKAYTFNLQKEKIESIDIDEIIKYEYKGSMFCAKNKHIDYCVTPKHRMFSAVGTTEIEDRQYRFDNAEDIVNKRRYHLVSSVKDGGFSVDNINLLKLCMMTIADGCVYQKKGCKKPFIRFSLKKERKKTELEIILNELNIQYNSRHCKNREKQGQFDVYEYTIESTIAKQIVDIIGKDKLIPLSFLEYDSDIIKQLMETYARFDGYFDKRDNCTGITISSIKEHNIDMLQSMCVLCGFRAIKSERIDVQTNFCVIPICYYLSISKNTTSRINEKSHSKQEYDGFVWCISNKNETIIVRRNGKVFITGNCKGEASDLDTTNDNRELFDYIRLHLPFDQVILEGGTLENPAWIHVSYSRTHNRGEVLTKIAGEEDYTPFKE